MDAGRGPNGRRDDADVYVISVAAELAGMHPQTLRQYDRRGLVSPSASGGGRRYSRRDVAPLREVQRFSQDEGVSLAGIQRILELESEVDRVRHQVDYLRAFVDAGRRVFTADPRGDVVAVNRTAQPQPPPDDHGGPRRGRPVAPDLPLSPPLNDSRPPQPTLLEEVWPGGLSAVRRRQARRRRRASKTRRPPRARARRPRRPSGRSASR